MNAFTCVEIPAQVFFRFISSPLFTTGIEGKYCLHFHKMQDCPECVFRGNAIENSQQRGIIVHGTHNTRVEDNVLYNVRGGNLYLEDGNEMWNTLAYNVAVCPFPFRDPTYRGCTVPGTSNSQADTSANQAGFYSNGASTNNFIGNRAANHFKYVFLNNALLFWNASRRIDDLIIFRFPS